MTSLFIILFMFIRKSSSEDDRKTTQLKIAHSSLQRRLSVGEFHLQF